MLMARHLKPRGKTATLLFLLLVGCVLLLGSPVLGDCSHDAEHDADCPAMHSCCMDKTFCSHAAALTSPRALNRPARLAWAVVNSSGITLANKPFQPPRS